MGITDTIHWVKNDSISDLICLDSIKTEADKERYNNDGYLIGYTAEEFKQTYPALDTSKIHFCNGFDKTFYFDRDKYILFNIHLFKNQYVSLFGTGSLEDDVLKIKNDFERRSGDEIYRMAVLHLNDRMRMEYLNLLLENNKTQGIYEIFMDYYKLSDFGCGSVSSDNMRKLAALKSETEKAATAELIKDLPDDVVLYRGEGNKSTPTDQSYSWTLDINMANFFATRWSDKNARLITAKTKKENIIEYFEVEQECIVLPDDIEITDTLDMYGTEGLSDKFGKVNPHYHLYRDLMLSHFDFNSQIHGAAHSARVLLLSLMLADAHGLNKRDKSVLAIASVYHDIGRTHDDVEDCHGIASAEFYKENPFYLPDFTSSFNPVSEFLIKYHCLPDEEGFAHIKTNADLSKNMKKNTLLFNIFKDADALDRIRLGYNDLDIRQLRLNESRKMPLIARLVFQNLKVSWDNDIDQTDKNTENETMSQSM